VTITLAESDTAVTLVVANDGPGIPPDQRARVFERFTRLDDARARDLGGTGLGLAVTHDVVVSHGARSSSTTRREHDSWSPLPVPG
jgi:signal transduction histidine kinase